MYFDLFSRRWVFAPDGVPNGGPAPTGETQQTEGQDSSVTKPAQVAGRDYEKEITDLRQESAKWRTQFQATQTALKELQTQAGDNKTLSDKLAGLEAQLAKAAADAETATKANQLIRLAVKAGVDPDVAALLDLSKVDLTDERKALEVLSKLKGSSGGKQAKPGVDSTEDLRAQLFSARKTSIFGG